MQNYNILSINDLYFCKIFSDEVRRIIITSHIIWGEYSNQYTATAGQTQFNLPSGVPEPQSTMSVKMFINGVRISNSAVSYSNRVVTYIPANNGNTQLVNNDRVVVEFFY